MHSCAIALAGLFLQAAAGISAGELMASSQGAVLVGEVADSQGRPLPGARIVVLEGLESGHEQSYFRDSPERIAQVLSDSQGRFEVPGLPSGRFDVEITAPSYAPALLPLVEIGAGEKRLQVGKVQMQPGVRLQFRVTDSGGEPVSGAEIGFYLRSSGLYANLFRRSSLTGRGISNRQGIFVLEDLEPREEVFAIVKHPDFADARVDVAQASSGEAVVALSAGGRIFGQLVDGQGNPLSQADLSLTSEINEISSRGSISTSHHEQTQTGKRGEFAFEHVKPGDVTIKVRAFGIQMLLDAFPIAEGQTRGPLQLVRKPTFNVTGQVLDAGRRPVEAAQLSLSPLGEEERPFAVSAQSAPDGSFRLENQPAGRFRLTVSHPVLGSVERIVEIGADENELELVMAPVGPVLTGQVVDEGGRPVKMATVRLEQNGGSISTGNISRFRFKEIKVGKYKLVAFKPGYAHAIHEGVVQPDDESLPPLELALSRGARLEGRINGLSREQLREVRIQALCERYTGYGQPIQGAASYDGSYRIDGLAPGQWEIQAELLGDNVQRLQGIVEVSDGQEDAWLDLDFGQGIQLSGLVLRNGRPLSGAAFSVRSERYQASGKLGQDGRIVFHDLKPGDYRVTVWGEGVYHNQELNLAQSREILIELQTTSLQGLLLDAETGTSVPAGQVVLTPLFDSDFFGAAPRQSATSDLQGRFELPYLPAGEYRLAAYKQGYLLTRQTIRLQAQPLDNLTLDMQPVEPLALKLRDWRGKAVPWVAFQLLDEQGRVILWERVKADAQGRVESPFQAPSGLSLVAGADGCALVPVGRQGGRAVEEVILPPATVLDIEVPDLAESDSAASLILRGPSESSHPLVLRYDRELMSQGEGRIFFLQQGTWQVEVRAKDGRVWRTVATTRPDTPAKTVLR